MNLDTRPQFQTALHIFVNLQKSMKIGLDT